jgi:hypothetical protein
MTGRAGDYPSRQMTKLRNLASRLRSRAGLLAELARFLWKRSNLWLLPLVLLLLIIGGLLMIANQPVVAPFVYTLF